MDCKLQKPQVIIVGHQYLFHKMKLNAGGILQAILWFSIKGGLYDNAPWIYQCK